MGLFDLFKRKEKQAVTVTQTNDDLLEEVEVAPGVILPKALANHWDEIEKTKLAYISIAATPSEQLDVQQSTFGYYPCLPKLYPYPRDVDGNYMYPLAQINCSELPVLSNYPMFGYLQFYISANNVYGVNFDNPQLQSHFKVLYFEEHEVKNFETDFSFLGHMPRAEYSPVYKPHKLEFSIKEEYFGTGDVRSEAEDAFNLSKITAGYPSIGKDLEEYVWDTFSSNGHKIGGYAYFTQTDPRSEEFEDYILLLQIDTDNDIMWGDSGVANFFIHPDDLEKKDFSKVFYTWDCC